MALSPTGDRLLWADGSSRIGVYDTSTNSNTILRGEGADYLEAITWNPVSDMAGYTFGRALALFSPITGDIFGHIASIDGAPVVAVAWSPDGQRLVTSHSADPTVDPYGDLNSISLWDNVATIDGINTTPHAAFTGRGGGNVEWSPDGERFAVLERGGFLVYDVIADRIETTVTVATGNSYVLRWSPDGSLLATGGSNIYIWDTEIWEVVGVISRSGGVARLQWSADGQHIFSERGSVGLTMDALPPEILTTPAP
jgi:WD40 repeat protein